MNKIKILLLVLTTIIGVPCSNMAFDDSKTEYCKNEKLLLSQSDTLTSIKISYHDFPEIILESIESQLEKELCWNEIAFNLILKNREKVRVFVFKECENREVGYLKKPNISIRLNDKGNTMLESQIMPIDSIERWIPNNFNIEGEMPDEFSLYWTTLTPSDSIEKTLHSIEKGYLLTCNKISNKIHHNAVCELTDEEFQSIGEIMPLKIKLGIGELNSEPTIPN